MSFISIHSGKSIIFPRQKYEQKNTPVFHFYFYLISSDFCLRPLTNFTPFPSWRFFRSLFLIHFVWLALACFCCRYQTPHASDSCIVRNNLKMHFIFVSMLVANSSPSCHSCRGEFDVILSLQQWGENERKGNVQGQCCLSVFRLPYWIMHNSTTGDFCNFSEQNVEHCNAWAYVMVFAWYFHSFMTHTQQNGRKIYVKRFSTQKLNDI